MSAKMTYKRYKITIKFATTKLIYTKINILFFIIAID